MEYRIDEKRVYICRGIPASGKSTWSRAFAKQYPRQIVRLSNDDVRRMMGAYWIPIREPLVKKTKQEAVRIALDNGYSVIADDMNLNQCQINATVNAAIKGWNTYTQRKHDDDTLFILRVIHVDFPVDLDTAIARDANRHGDEHIGADVIRMNYDRYHDVVQSGDSYPVFRQTAFLTYCTKAAKQKHSYIGDSSQFNNPAVEILSKIPISDDPKKLA
jgi:tRNA uridine 5-carbamoylmethylation protein Kti12